MEEESNQFRFIHNNSHLGQRPGKLVFCNCGAIEEILFRLVQHKKGIASTPSGEGNIRLSHSHIQGSSQITCLSTDESGFEQVADQILSLFIAGQQLHANVTMLHAPALCNTSIYASVLAAWNCPTLNKSTKLVQNVIQLLS